MAKNNLPTYAIVELLIRLTPINPTIGDYKGHLVYDDGVIVKTTHGTIKFSLVLIMQQFNHPESITEDVLKTVACDFKAAR